MASRNNSQNRSQQESQIRIKQREDLRAFKDKLDQLKLNKQMMVQAQPIKIQTFAEVVHAAVQENNERAISPIKIDSEISEHSIDFELT